MRRRIWILSIAVIVVCVSILFALYVNNSLSSSPQGINAFSDFHTMTIGPHYLSRSPHFPNNSNKITKIFLESATLRYDYSNVSFTSDSGYDPYVGVDAVVINATIRNDYLVEEIIQFSPDASSYCVVGIDVYMYDNKGDFVATLQSGDPFQGSYTLSLKSGEVNSVDMVFVTPNRNISYFEIFVSYLPGSNLK